MLGQFSLTDGLIINPGMRTKIIAVGFDEIIERVGRLLDKVMAGIHRVQELPHT